MEKLNNNYKRSCTAWWFSILAWLFVIYITLFVLVMLDEVWLETRLIGKHAPRWAEEVFTAIYAPLLSDFWKVSETVTVLP